METLLEAKPIDNTKTLLEKKLDLIETPRKRKPDANEKSPCKTTREVVPLCSYTRDPSILYIFLKTVSCEFDEVRVDSHLCKLRTSIVRF